MGAAEELVEAHVEDRGDEVFSQYRITLKPRTAPQPAPVASTRRTRGRAKKGAKAPQDTNEEALWHQFWVVVLYIGLDGAKSFSDAVTWATSLEAPLLLDVFTTKFTHLTTRQQQVSLIFRVRNAWGRDFYRTLRRLNTPILLPRVPAHGFLTQLAKLADRQSLTDFSEQFPLWLVIFIRNSNTPVASLAAHERGKREVGRADLLEYLNYLTTNENVREEALHSCPRLTFNESNKRRRIAPASPQSPQHIEQPRLETSRSSQEPLDDIDEGIRLPDDLPPPYSPIRESPRRTPDLQPDEELDISGVDFVANSSDNENTPNTSTLRFPEDTMVNQRRQATSLPSAGTTSPTSPLSATAVHTAGATTLQARIQSRHTALAALSRAKSDLSTATTALSNLVSTVHDLLGIGEEYPDTRAALQSAIAHDTAELAKLTKAHAALEAFRATLRGVGVGEGDDALAAIGMPNAFDDSAQFDEAVNVRERSLAGLQEHLEAYQDALVAKETANNRVGIASNAVKVENDIYQAFVRTVVALGEVEDEEVLGEALRLF